MGIINTGVLSFILICLAWQIPLLALLVWLDRRHGGQGDGSSGPHGQMGDLDRQLAQQRVWERDAELRRGRGERAR